MDPIVAKHGGNTNEPREYRKGNWTVQETMILIEAKKMDDERRMRRAGDGGEKGKPAELRWKWVENYCSRKGCFRSQNQCNDKWDNLMRDFKKVREYEGRVAEMGGGEKSYWRIEKNERKDNNLPTNMLPEIYEALVAVVEKKGQRAAVGSGGAGSSRVLGQQSMHHQVQQPPIIQQPTTLPPFPSPAEPPTLPPPQPLPIVDSDTSEHSGSPAKRRKRGGGEGTSGGAFQEVGSAISEGASIIAEAIQSSEERQERRHRQMLSLHERRLQLEESKAEINRQGINGLVDSINKLASSILALAGHRSQAPPPE